MKQWWLAAAALLSLSAGLGRADYVLIIANLNAARPENLPRPGQGAQGQFGAAGFMGIPGQGGVTGLPGGGVTGLPQPGGGVTGLPQPGGATGYPGSGVTGFPQPGGATGYPGGVTGFPRPGGATGGPGIPGGVTGGPGIPPGGFMGIPGAPGMGGAPGADPNIDETPALKVMAVIETTNRPNWTLFARQGYVHVDHKWGQTMLLPGLPNVMQIIPLRNRDNKSLPSIEQQYEARYQEVTKGKKASTADMLALAEWALEHGLIDKFIKLMDGLALSEKSHPVVAAYLKVKADLAKPITKEDKSAKYWKDNLFTQYRIATSPHYSLLHTAPKNDAVEVTSRLQRLEENLQGFYYWFTLRGVTLPVPDERLVGLLVPPGRDPGEEFYLQNKHFDKVPINQDAFYSRRQNIVVFSSTRLDPSFEALMKLTQDMWRKMDRDQILKPKAHRPRDVTPVEFILGQNVSTLIKAMQDDAEQAAVSHEGTRQLVVASGLLPRNLEAPEWIQSGMASLFETPPGSPWRGYGAPHWPYLFSLAELQKANKLDKPADMLKKVVTDAYFKEKKKDDKTGNGTVKARATAWALTYFLARTKTANLMRYYEELRKLPRDLELDEEVLLDCFARAFDCVKPDKTRDEGKLTLLASEWNQVLTNVHPDGEDLLKELYKWQNELAQENKADKPKTGGGRPGYPGTGYPGTGYPGTGYPGSGYPGTGPGTTPPTYPGTGGPGTTPPTYPGTGRPGTTPPTYPGQGGGRGTPPQRPGGR